MECYEILRIRAPQATLIMAFLLCVDCRYEWRLRAQSNARPWARDLHVGLDLPQARRVLVDLLHGTSREDDREERPGSLLKSSNQFDSS